MLRAVLGDTQVNRDVVPWLYNQFYDMFPELMNQSQITLYLTTLRRSTTSVYFLCTLRTTENWMDLFFPFERITQEF